SLDSRHALLQDRSVLLAVGSVGLEGPAGGALGVPGVLGAGGDRSRGGVRVVLRELAGDSRAVVGEHRGARELREHAEREREKDLLEAHLNSPERGPKGPRLPHFNRTDQVRSNSRPDPVSAVTQNERLTPAGRMMSSRFWKAEVTCRAILRPAVLSTFLI